MLDPGRPPSPLDLGLLYWTLVRLCLEIPPRYVRDMLVTAISTPGHPLWRWRITEYTGEVIEESHEDFATLAAALAVGTKRLASMNVVDRPRPAVGGPITGRDRDG